MCGRPQLLVRPQVNLRLRTEKKRKKKNNEELFPKLSSLLYFGAYFIEAKWRCSSRQHILIQSQHSPPPFLPPAISSAKQLRENLLICSRCCCCLFAGLLLARNSTFWLPAKCCECPQCMPHHTPHTQPNPFTSSAIAAYLNAALVALISYSQLLHSSSTFSI